MDDILGVEITLLKKVDNVQECICNEQLRAIDAMNNFELWTLNTKLKNLWMPNLWKGDAIRNSESNLSWVEKAYRCQYLVVKLSNAHCWKYMVVMISKTHKWKSMVIIWKTYKWKSIVVIISKAHRCQSMVVKFSKAYKWTSIVVIISNAHRWKSMVVKTLKDL